MKLYIKEFYKTKEIKNHYAIGIPALLATLFGIWKIISLNSSISDISKDNPFAQELGMSVSIGFGLYLAIMAGIALLVYIYTNRPKTS